MGKRNMTVKGTWIYRNCSNILRGETVSPKVLDFDDNKHDLIRITLVNWVSLK